METIWLYQFRLIVIGDSTVGKSCLIRRFTEGRFAQVSDPTWGWTSSPAWWRSSRAKESNCRSGTQRDRRGSGQRQVSLQEAEKLAGAFGMRYVETSARESINVEKIQAQE
ncbi:hypothetical protein F7725_006919 [Dissostichus mawsoni]|uniref:Uncharacterized protein n=1 Tax=Dissostichus mawsoni TaxID=36200 RepID=A0A7J5XWX6_DISMA|nr:hypothetical protein F7725_006919 [Dissostichus mawsoni]